MLFLVHTLVTMIVFLLVLVLFGGALCEIAEIQPGDTIIVRKLKNLTEKLLVAKDLREE